MNWEQYVDAQGSALSSLDKRAIENFVAELRNLQNSGNTLWVGGNGGSSATASHAAADLTKTVSQTGSKPVITLSLSEALSLTTASANDLDFESSLANSIRLMAKPGDAVLMISVSGTSPNLVALMAEAKKRGLLTLSMVGSAGEEESRKADASIVVKSFDYQIVENTHLILLHWFVKALQDQVQTVA